MAVFHGIPAIYNFHHFKQAKRRTATSIMAGCFDPLPYSPSDFVKDTDSSSTTSSISHTESVSHAGATHSTESRKTTSKKSKGPSGEKGKKGNVVSVSVKVGDGKGKWKKQGKGEEKENTRSAVATGEPRGSIFPGAIYSAIISPLGAISNAKDARSAVGVFWYPHSSNISVSPAPPSLKRKRSSASCDDASARTKASSNKRSRLSEAPDAISRGSSQVFSSSVNPGSPPSSPNSSHIHIHPDEMDQDGEIILPKNIILT
ncbi:hypothetical protein M422DRAFT_69469 [Sphaerobolus stellatus SS14]|uniref:Uncharacterized protein n=1 Tax=Sphaerobolus stellatus (strain SS14) TaxID=990650 RepID=A0A0C9V638_SPHS4|nr:hypothetical protein M422DRAFT_69469 [Sphaerobolus stellatus SS14]